MQDTVNLQIHFYSKHSASVTLDSSSSGEERKRLEIWLFCLHVFRMMVTMGIESDNTTKLALMLVKAAEDEKHMMHILTSPTAPIKIRDYTGKVGEKVFSINMRLGEVHIESIRMKQQGFGFLAKGIEEYSIDSVMCLLRHFGNQRIEDMDHVRRLFAAGVACGYLAMQRKLTMANQTDLAAMVMAQVVTGDN